MVVVCMWLQYSESSGWSSGQTCQPQWWSAGICYTARVCSAAAVAKADMQQQVCSAHTIAAGLSGSVFMPACLKSFHDHRYAAGNSNALLPSWRRTMRFVHVKYGAALSSSPNRSIFDTKCIHVTIEVLAMLNMIGCLDNLSCL